MNGAQSLLATLTRNGIDVCFANPGTSELHFVAALDHTEGMRCVLGLFEGVLTGAADGYARMADRPASTLMHLGPGLANGLSNLHNAMRAHPPIVNIIGDHATYHRHVRRTRSPRTLREPHARSATGCGPRRTRIPSPRTPPPPSRPHAPRPGKIASLILPADASWTPLTAEPAAAEATVPPPPRVSGAAVDAAARVLRSGETAALILGPQATRETPLERAGQIADVTGARLYAPTHTARITRGAGRVPVQRVPYPVGQAAAAFDDVQNIILVGAKPPVAFFAYPGKPSQLSRPGTRICELARADQDVPGALAALCDALGAGSATPKRAELSLPDRPTGTLTPEKIGAVLAASLPEHAIVVDESITTGRSFLADTERCRPHDWLLGTGGSIGYALPCATGAATACPGRKVVVLESDGSGMYMPQALWTQAREQLDVLTIVFANSTYQILRDEMSNVGVTAGGPKTEALTDIGNPRIDWMSLARAFGVEAFRATTADELSRHIDAGLALQGPVVIEAAL